MASANQAERGRTFPSSSCTGALALGQSPPRFCPKSRAGESGVTGEIGRGGQRQLIKVQSKKSVAGSGPFLKY